MKIEKEEIRRLAKKFDDELKDKVLSSEEAYTRTATVRSKEYRDFKNKYMPKHLSLYEKGCKFAGKILNVKPDKKKEEQYQKDIDFCHLSATPTGVYSFSMLMPIAIIFVGALISLGFFQSKFLLSVFMILGAMSFGPFAKMPETLANKWRMMASNQMVLAVFYMVTYMRHTSNLEHAIKFASDHLGPPLSFDLKKVLWDIEAQRFESIKESLDNYLDGWRDTNIEFVEAVNLVEASLFETAEDRRITILEKSLSVILDETYEKMLHYTQGLKGPITTLNMLGVILPILGLVILPLVVSFMEGARWYHIMGLYNILLPIAVYHMGSKILANRPSGYGATQLDSDDPEVKKKQNFVFKFAGDEIFIPAKSIAIIIFIVCFIGATFPIWFHEIAPDFEVGFLQPSPYDPPKYYLMGYKTDANGDESGPFGVGATLISLLFPISMGLSLGIYYKTRSRYLIKVRNDSKRLETEFAAALFQLGNRLGDGLPPEIAFEKVSRAMPGTVSGSFYAAVSNNITRLGRSVEDAIFNPVNGALKDYPSPLIESSMRILVESVKKGPTIAAEALTSVSRYIKEMHRVEERLIDLLSDVISSMKGQVKFLTPAISGIVIGITSMITGILGRLSDQMKEFEADSAGVGGLTTMFGEGIPTYFFQMSVGIYVVQIAVILVILSNGIENGEDELNKQYELGTNLIRSVILYCMISGALILLFNMIASSIMAASG